MAICVVVLHLAQTAEMFLTPVIVWSMHAPAWRWTLTTVITINIRGDKDLYQHEIILFLT
jgi:hypothetical protein